jgi:hypothetical protein
MRAGRWDRAAQMPPVHVPRTMRAGRCLMCVHVPPTRRAGRCSPLPDVAGRRSSPRNDAARSLTPHPLGQRVSVAAMGPHLTRTTRLCRSRAPLVSAIPTAAVGVSPASTLWDDPASPCRQYHAPPSLSNAAPITRTHAGVAMSRYPRQQRGRVAAPIPSGRTGPDNEAAGSLIVSPCAGPCVTLCQVLVSPCVRSLCHPVSGPCVTLCHFP